VRILQLANKIPYPPKDGGSLGIHNFTNALLKAGHQVKVIAVNTPKLFTPLSEIDPRYIRSTDFEAVWIDTRVKTHRAFLNLFSSKSYNIERFNSPALHLLLKSVFEKQDFDIVQLESVFMAPYVETIRRYSKAKIVLRAHNVEHFIWQRLAQNEGFIAKKWYLNFLAKRLKQYELSMLNRYDGITCVTAAEANQWLAFGCTIPLCQIPFAIDVKNISLPEVNEEPYSVFSLAAMDWLPNLQGMQWFLDEVWNKVLDRVPAAMCYVAGRNMSREWMKKSYPRVKMMGEVNDAATFMASKQVMVVPLFSGGGVRVKIIEGFARQKAIVSTAVGAEGIDYEAGVHLLEANDAETFADSIVELLTQHDKRKTIARQGRLLAEKVYDIDLVTQKLIGFYQQLLTS
jgi:glycosyltransferase involved in cell wall biosynthesis